jgi:hypothetical protein
MRRRPNWLIPAVIAAVVVLLIGVVAVTSGGDDGNEETTPTTTAGPGEIFLQPIAESGPDPFGPSSAAATPKPTVPPGTPVTLGPNSTAPAFPKGSGSSGASGPLTITSMSGGTPGLYGGTLNQQSCDKKKMIAFLEANPD